MPNKKNKKGLIRATLLIFGATLLIVALSIKYVPEWLSIPGGVEKKKTETRAKPTPHKI